MYMKDIALTMDFALSAGGAGWAATTGWPGGRRRLPCSVLRRWLWWRRMNTPMWLRRFALGPPWRLGVAPPCRSA